MIRENMPGEEQCMSKCSKGFTQADFRLARTNLIYDYLNYELSYNIIGIQAHTCTPARSFRR